MKHGKYQIYDVKNYSIAFSNFTFADRELAKEQILDWLQSAGKTSISRLMELYELSPHKVASLHGFRIVRNS